MVQGLGGAFVDVSVAFFRLEEVKSVREAGVTENLDRRRIVIGVQIAGDDDMAVGIGAEDLLHNRYIPGSLRISARFGGFFSAGHAGEVVVENVQGGWRAAADDFEPNLKRRAAGDAFGCFVLCGFQDFCMVCAHKVADVNPAAVCPFNQDGLVGVAAEDVGIGNVFEDFDILHFLQGNNGRSASSQDGVGGAGNIYLVLADIGQGRAGGVRFQIVEEILNIPGHYAELTWLDLRECRRGYLLWADGGGGSESDFVIAEAIGKRTGDVAKNISGVGDEGQRALIKMGDIAAVVKHDLEAVLLTLIEPVYAMFGEDEGQFAVFVNG